MVTDRIGAGPISWGVCEVPGWGVMLDADRVLGEMRSLGIRAVELGAPGFLPRDPAPLRAALDRHGVRLIGGFVPLVLHDPRGSASARWRRPRPMPSCSPRRGPPRSCRPSSSTRGGRRRFPLSAAQWDHLVGMLGELDELCADHGLVHALHPHVGTLVETIDDVREVLERSPVKWCLDTGHLLIGGYDPAQFAADAAGRIAHVHAKDVRLDLADRARRGETVVDRRRPQRVVLPAGSRAMRRSRRPSSASSATATRGGTCSNRTPTSGPSSRRQGKVRSTTSGRASSTYGGYWRAQRAG